MLESSILEQIKEIYKELTYHYVINIKCDKKLENAHEMLDMMDDVASCSDKIACNIHYTDNNELEFSIERDGFDIGVKFNGVPNGHEFTSLLLAILNADGKGKNLPDDFLRRRIENLNGPIALKTYVSLTCTNCPEIVQALNIIAILNPVITHEMIDGGLHQEEIDKLNIKSVPTVYANDEQIHVGRGDIGILLNKLEEKFGSKHPVDESISTHHYDVIVIGGGPAGTASAIYSARKGLKVAVIAERIGGQVKETTGIENLISVPQTTGERLAADLKVHISDYPIDIYESRKIEAVDFSNKEKVISTGNGESFAAPAIIIATGASWRRLNVENEEDYIGKGVAFCPHCDGPFFKDKSVAVIGGGNSGVEAAIDLSGICKDVTIFEFSDSLKADDVLQKKASSIPNIRIVKMSQTTKIIGDGTKVTGIRIKDRDTDKESDYKLDGIFVQIGLSANSAPFKDALQMTNIGEIIIDRNCRTEVKGVYAAGDVSNIPYKQIIIAMGEGAKAALSAFDDRIKGII